MFLMLHLDNDLPEEVTFKLDKEGQGETFQREKSICQKNLKIKRNCMILQIFSTQHVLYLQYK